MITLIVRHEVADYERWKPIFDAHEPARRRAGIVAHTLHRDLEQPSMISIVFEAVDLEALRRFVASDELRKAMKSGGVIGIPEVQLLEDLEEVRYGAAELPQPPAPH